MGGDFSGKNQDCSKGIYALAGNCPFRLSFIMFFLLGVPWLLSGLRIQCCYCCGLGHFCGANSVPSPGTCVLWVQQSLLPPTPQAKKKKKTHSILTYYSSDLEIRFISIVHNFKGNRNTTLMYILSVLYYRTTWKEMCFGDKFWLCLCHNLAHCWSLVFAVE